MRVRGERKKRRRNEPWSRGWRWGIRHLRPWNAWTSWWRCTSPCWIGACSSPRTRARTCPPRSSPPDRTAAATQASCCCRRRRCCCFRLPSLDLDLDLEFDRGIARKRAKGQRTPSSFGFLIACFFRCWSFDASPLFLRGKSAVDCAPYTWSFAVVILTKRSSDRLPVGSTWNSRARAD